jgi:hypothetical protein
LSEDLRLAVAAKQLLELRPHVRQPIGRSTRQASTRRVYSSALRLHDAVAREVETAERSLAEQALASADVKSLMTILGIGAITALALTRVIGVIEAVVSRSSQLLTTSDVAPVCIEVSETRQSCVPVEVGVVKIASVTRRRAPAEAVGSLESD